MLWPRLLRPTTRPAALRSKSANASTSRCPLRRRHIWTRVQWLGLLGPQEAEKRTALVTENVVMKSCFPTWNEHRLDRRVGTESGHDRIAHQLGQLRVEPLRQSLVFTTPIIFAHMRPHAFDHVWLLVQRAQNRRCATALTPLGRVRFFGCRVVAIEKLAAPALFHAFSLLVSGGPLQRSPSDELA